MASRGPSLHRAAASSPLDVLTLQILHHGFECRNCTAGQWSYGHNEIALENPTYFRHQGFPDVEPRWGSLAIQGYCASDCPAVHIIFHEITKLTVQSVILW